ncbi:hypothetical protein KC865_04150 [Candidatus Kaiserbacteria bacterium]|nr:hypothetical protein [Candidatus Kaiserbacteria bacterium]USN92696.1 MAG: hypothetical protein H6782_02690 [Candidatus Nomurabacteria bacterium]
MIEENIHFKSFIRFILLTIGFLCILTYITFQARFIIIGPQINLTDEAGLLHNERQIFLSGRTHNISHLWLNDRPIYTDAQGKFNEALVLENGYTVATLRAKDRYGRETKVTRGFVYAPVSFAGEIK